MSEYWKSTPHYWCKFCSTYIRDTGLERKNHDASAKHRNGIQRSLRELHKRQERGERERRWAREEVGRLNGLVSGGGKMGGGGGGSRILGGSGSVAGVMGPPVLSQEQQRRVHAEQLAALGVELPEGLKREVTGVGGWRTVAEEVVEDLQRPEGRSLAEIVKREGESGEVVGEGSRGVRKRKVEGEEVEEQYGEDEATTAPRRKVWGSTLKTYPNAPTNRVGDGDLDALLSGVTKKPKEEVKMQADESEVKQEDEDQPLSVSALPDTRDASANAAVKSEDSGEAVCVPSPVVFKKRKVRR